VSVRTRFALLYAGAFFVSGVLLFGVALFTVSSTTHVGSSGPPHVSHPANQTIEPTATAVVSLVTLVVLSVAGRLLRPVRMITATAQDISASNLGRRLRLGRRDDEFTRLGETLNDLFGRLEASFHAQRHFVANASHELRTPLTAERTLLQVTLADPDADAATLREACEQVLALGTQTERLIDALLTLATSERGIERRAPLDLAGLAGQVARTREPGEISLVTDLDPAWGMGDPRLAESLIANLVDNALRYNVPEGWVKVATATVAGCAVVSVRNSGPVVPPAEVERLFQPFQRLQAGRASRASGHGHGLGLAIVRAIADAHGAHIRAQARDEGGLDVAVTFPAG
jgi:signal transduction histidine kinase